MTFKAIYPKEIKKLQQKENAIIVDIRDNAEYRMGHYPGAINLPLDEIDDCEQKFRRSQFYILYCAHGGSSMQYARDLGHLGYHVATVLGGWDAMQDFIKKTLEEKSLL